MSLFLSHGRIIIAGKDRTEEIADRFLIWIGNHQEILDENRLESVIAKAAYVCKLDRRTNICEHVFVLADEMDSYAKTHPNGRFAGNWQRACRVIGAESCHKYWAKNRISTAAGLWQFLDSTCNWFGANQIRIIARELERSGDAALPRIGGLHKMLWATNQSEVYGLMRPHPGHGNSLPGLNAPRSRQFQRLFEQNRSDGVSDEEAFIQSVEDVIRFQVNIGCRLLDSHGWSQWEVCTRYGF